MTGGRGVNFLLPNNKPLIQDFRGKPVKVLGDRQKGNTWYCVPITLLWVCCRQTKS